MAAKELKKLSLEEVAKHNKPDDLWIVVDAKVYDVTRFKALHPGGASVFLDEDIGALTTSALRSRALISLQPVKTRLTLSMVFIDMK